MVCKIKKVLLIALLLAAQSTSQELNSTLHLTAYGVQIAFVDEVVVFTCVVRGSNNMAWTSDEYIGANRQLSLVSAQPIGHEVRAVANNQTVAVLVDATIDVIIISELRIRINSVFSIASVECTNVGANTRTLNSTSFRLAGAALVACDKWLVCSGESVMCSCATGNSSTHAWITNGTRIVFTSDDRLGIGRDVPGSSTYAVLTESSDRNGVRVIMSNITVSASKESNNIILTCENVDSTMTEPVIIPIENCPVDVDTTDEVTTSAGNDNAPSRDPRTGPIVAVIAVPIIVTIVAVILIMIIAIIAHKRENGFKKQLVEKDEKIQSLDDQLQQPKNWSATGAAGDLYSKFKQAYNYASSVGGYTQND